MFRHVSVDKTNREQKLFLKSTLCPLLCELAYNWPLTILWLTDELSQSTSMFRHVSVDKTNREQKLHFKSTPCPLHCELAHNWPLTILWLTDELSQSTLMFRHVSVDKTNREQKLLSKSTPCPLLCELAPNWPLTILWLTDELSQSTLMFRHVSVDRPVECPNKACGCAVLEKNCKVLWGCADQTRSSNTRGVAYLSKWMELSIFWWEVNVEVVNLFLRYVLGWQGCCF